MTPSCSYAGGIAHHRQSVRDILDHDRPGTDRHTSAYPRSFPDHRTDTDPGPGPNADVARKVRSGRDMHAFMKMAVVIDAGTGVHDNACRQNRRRLNYRSGHHDAAEGTGGVGADRCATMNEHCYGMTLP